MKDLAKKNINSSVKCKAYKVGNIAISSNLKINQVIKQDNRLLQGLRRTNSFYFICNNAIDHTFQWKYGLDLTYEVVSKLSDNFLDYTSFLLPSNDFNVNKFNNNLVF